MRMTEGATTIAVLLSGGLDSSILLASLLASGRTVRPIHIRTGVAWQEQEEAAIRRFLRACRGERLLDLVSLSVPLADLYGDHWSLTGRDVPDGDTADEAVFLPGRNSLLLVKAAVWCGMRGIDQIALATLSNNPFADATDHFFSTFEEALSLGMSASIRIVRPFSHLSKQEVMQLACDLPLQHTFSCIAPADSLHCGACNKCAERQLAFAAAGLADPTRYAAVKCVTSVEPAVH